MTPAERTGARALTVGAAACAACCAGPILGALGAIGIASLAGYLLAGTLALAAGLAAVAVAAVVLHRRRAAYAASVAPAGEQPVRWVRRADEPAGGAAARSGHVHPL